VTGGATTAGETTVSRVISVNVGMPIEVPYQGRTVRTGIFKSPVSERLAVRRTGIAGDGQADLEVHGGVDKAVYVYSEDSYLWWAGELGHSLQPGELGENLTVRGLTDDLVRIGDRMRIGDVLVEVTQPREPCFKLGIRMGDKRFVARFRDAGRTGFYLRVLEEGTVAPGDAVVLVRSDPAAPTIAEVHDLYVNGAGDAERLRCVAAAPGLSEGWRAWMERRIAEAGTRVS
jgi:MOSC domain-containing protein YiiM